MQVGASIMKNIDVVLYHANCPDGFTAAWAIFRAYPAAITIPVQHGKHYPEQLEDKDVVIVDFCYPREIMIELNKITKSLLCLDHHITAKDQCEDLGFCKFDLTKSGAGLAWDYFYESRRPWLVDYIEYRDLGFVWTKPESEHPNNLEAALAAVDSYQKTFDQWEKLAFSYSPDFSDNCSLVAEGKAILRYKKQLIDQIVGSSTVKQIDGDLVSIANSPVLQSEVGNRLVKENQCAYSVVWSEQVEQIRVSLRSEDGKQDVSKVAGKYPGGGGHRNAAGFRLDRSNIEDLLNQSIENKDNK